MKKRADVLLTEQGKAPSRSLAQAWIMAGRVYVESRRIDKAGTLLPVDAPLWVKASDRRFVSRGGTKLAGALEAFGYDPAGKTAADFGASTGGFSDCLLQQGAVRIYAIDVGYGQLANRLRQDSRVVVMERTNARHVELEHLAAPVDLVVIDASFISLEKLLPAAARVLAAKGDVLAMVKPQFEVGRDRVGKGGVVRDPELRKQAIAEVRVSAETLGFAIRDEADAVLSGPKGNQETFLWLEWKRHPAATPASGSEAP